MSTHERILEFTERAARGMNRKCKYMYFDQGLKFIVDGDRLKLLPLKYHHLYTKDEFYVWVNPVDKRVMYYAYDLIRRDHHNEEEGYMEWDEVEDCLYNFFVLCIEDIMGLCATIAEVYPESYPGDKAGQGCHPRCRCALT